VRVSFRVVFDEKSGLTADDAANAGDGKERREHVFSANSSTACDVRVMGT
jgi:hypothetical protein